MEIYFILIIHFTVLSLWFILYICAVSMFIRIYYMIFMNYPESYNTYYLFTVSMYIGSNNRPCRNGPTCYYLKRNRCFFYHPPSHYQNLSNPSDRHFPKSNPLFKHSNSELKTLLKTISVLSLSEKIQKKKEEEENNFFIDNGTKVAMIPIKSTIKDKDKSWFF